MPSFPKKPLCLSQGTSLQCLFFFFLSIYKVISCSSQYFYLKRKASVNSYTFLTYITVAFKDTLNFITEPCLLFSHFPLALSYLISLEKKEKKKVKHILSQMSCNVTYYSHKQNSSYFHGNQLQKNEHLNPYLSFFGSNIC